MNIKVIERQCKKNAQDALSEIIEEELRQRLVISDQFVGRYRRLRQSGLRQSTSVDTNPPGLENSSASW